VSARAKAAGVRVTPERLMAEAERARTSAYAPYSKFKVGAALLTRDGRIVHGCNVENASFGLSICAERNAVWKAVSEGVGDFVAIAVTAGDSGGASPCGACRQVLNELAPGVEVYWRDGSGRLVKDTIAGLLPRPFVWPKAKR
jgi:cytidine deaminase